MTKAMLSIDDGRIPEQMKLFTVMHRREIDRPRLDDSRARRARHSLARLSIKGARSMILRVRVQENGKGRDGSGTRTPVNIRQWQVCEIEVSAMAIITA